MSHLPNPRQVELRKRLKMLSYHETMRVKHNEQNYILRVADLEGIPIFTHKLANGEAIEVTRLKVVPLHRCPKCGYTRGKIVQ